MDDKNKTNNSKSENGKTKTAKKVSKKVARSTKNRKSTTKNGDGEKSVAVDNSQTVAKKSSLINDGKCCRCVFRNKEKKCSCKKSDSHGKYVARKSGCGSFKYAN